MKSNKISALLFCLTLSSFQMLFAQEKPSAQILESEKRTKAQKRSTHAHKQSAVAEIPKHTHSTKPSDCKKKCASKTPRKKERLQKITPEAPRKD